ncbi:MAG: Do family serine endopeptidase [Fretibacterium sp.]|nr:Do family serine endopeptidase [Fretibacterium sp.]
MWNCVRNHRKFPGLILALALVLGMMGSEAALAVSSSASNPIVNIVKKASPAVVNIDVETKARRSISPFPFDDDPIFRHFFGDAFRDFTRSVPMKGRGSGFIVTKDGQILTNNHVVDGVDKIMVSVLMSDGSKKTYPARVLGSDPTYDLAVIKIDPDGDLPVLLLGDSDEVEPGEWVVAIGNPYGFEHSVTAGVISAKDRSIHAQDVNFDGFLQTDAAINPGNSGGPLLNMDGQVVGINTAIIPYAQGLGFAIPVNMAKEVMNDLVSYGKVKRGWLGVSIQNVTPEIARAYGVKGEGGAIVSDVFGDSAAERAGVRRGDVVIELNGEKVKDVNWFVQKVRTLTPGSTATLQVVRNGRKMTLKVKLDERPDSADARPGQTPRSPRGRKNDDSVTSDALEDFGIEEVTPLTSGLRRQFKIAPDSEGLVIIDVDSDSPASTVGIREGDLLHQVNGRDVRTFDDLNKAMQDKSDSVVLMIERSGNTFIVSLKKESKD